MKRSLFSIAAAALSIFPILELGDGVLKLRRPTAIRFLRRRFRQRVIDYLADEFKKDQGIDLRKIAWRCKRQRGGREAKCELSSSMETDINLPFVTADQSGPKHLNMKLPSKLEALCAD